MKKGLSVMLVFAMILIFCTPALAAGDYSEQEQILEGFAAQAKSVIAPEDFEKAVIDGERKSGSIVSYNTNTTYASLSAETVSDMSFTKALKFTCLQEHASLCMLKLNFDALTPPTALTSPGDTVLLKFKSKLLAGDGKMQIRLWNDADWTTNANDAIPNTQYTQSGSDWQCWYIPAKIPEDAVGGLDQLIIKIGSTQGNSMLFSELELINYGTSVSVDQLPRGAYTIPTYSEDGSAELISQSDFINSAVAIDSAYGTVTTSVTTDASVPFTDTLTVACSQVPSSASGFGIRCDVNSSAEKTASGNVVLLTFYAKAKSKNQTVRAVIQGDQSKNMAAYTYYIPTQWTKICMPATVTGETVRIALETGSDTGEIEFGGVSLKNYGTDSETDAAKKLMYTLPQGYFLMEEFEQASLEYSSGAFVNQTSTTDLCSYGNYLFAIGGGQFRIFNVQTPSSPVLLGSISKLGEVRQLRISEDGNTAVVTARANKAYVIDCSNKQSPVIASRYDTVEYATGLAVGDGRAYITNRMYGTEILDISDPYHAKCLAVLRTGEGQSCTLSGSRLFIGCWGERCVEVWDVADPSNAKLLTKNIPLTGLGDGVAIDGNYLYAATGHYQDAQGRVINNVGFGLGNGMDIYDVSDLSNPVRIATVKIDDHFYQTGGDFWKVTLAQQGENKYAYLTNTYTGVYVYNVTNPYAPIRLAHITLDIDKTLSSAKYQSNFSNQKNNGTDRYYPFDVTSKGQDAVTGVCSYEGYLYLSGNATGIALLNADYGHEAITVDNRGNKKEDSGTFFDIDTTALAAAGFTDIAYARPDGQVYGAVKRGNYIYAACGTEGILIYDDHLSKLSSVPSADITSDIQLFDNKIYTAEGMGGVVVYEISEDGLSLNKLSSYVYSDGWSNYPVTMVRLSPKGNFVLCDSGSGYSELVDFRNIEEPVSFRRNRLGGLYYSRQALNGTAVANRFLCIYDHIYTTQWYDFGADNGNDPVYFTLFQKSGMGMTNGITSVGSRALATTSGGYALFDPSDSSLAETSTIWAGNTVFHYLRSDGTTDASSVGKPIAYGSTLFVNDKRNGGCSIVDILDVSSPKMKASVSFAGNPDVAYLKDGEVIYSLGYQGILKFTLGDEGGLPVDVTLSGNGTVSCDGAEYTDNQLFYLDASVNKTLTVSAPDGMVIDYVLWEGSESAQRYVAPELSGEMSGAFDFQASESGTLTVICRKASVQSSVEYSWGVSANNYEYTRDGLPVISPYSFTIYGKATGDTIHSCGMYFKRIGLKNAAVYRLESKGGANENGMFAIRIVGDAIVPGLYQIQPYVVTADEQETTAAPVEYEVAE